MISPLECNVESLACHAVIQPSNPFVNLFLFLDIAELTWKGLQQVYMVFFLSNFAISIFNIIVEAVHRPQQPGEGPKKASKGARPKTHLGPIEKYHIALHRAEGV